MYNSTSVYALDSCGYLLGPVSVATPDNYLYLVQATNSYVLDGATKFIYVNRTKDENNNTVYAGTVNIVTGYNNISAMNTVDGSYVDADGNGVAEVVFIYTQAASSATVNYAYFLGTTTFNGSYYSYDFIVRGTATTIGSITSGLTVGVPGMYSISSGVATAVFGNSDTNLAIDTSDGIYNNKAVSYDGTLVKINGTVVGVASPTIPVYFIDTVFDPTTGTAIDLDTAVIGDIIIAQNSTVVTAIYIVM